MYTSPSQSHLTSDHQHTRSLTLPPDYTRNASFRVNRSGSRSPPSCSPATSHGLRQSDARVWRLSLPLLLSGRRRICITPHIRDPNL